MQHMRLEHFRLPKRHSLILNRAVECGLYSSKSDAVRAGIEKIGLEIELAAQGATA